jgi:hypothetical protein
MSEDGGEWWGSCGRDFACRGFASLSGATIVKERGRGKTIVRSGDGIALGDEGFYRRFQASSHRLLWAAEGECDGKR